MQDVAAWKRTKQLTSILQDRCGSDTFTHGGRIGGAFATLMTFGKGYFTTLWPGALIHRRYDITH